MTTGSQSSQGSGSQGSSSQQQSSQGSSILALSRWSIRDSNQNNDQGNTPNQNNAAQSRNNTQQLTSLIGESRTLFQKYGATSVQCYQVQIGQHAGSFVTAIEFPSWESYGTAMQHIQQDDSYTNMQNQVRQIARLDDSSIISELNLSN